MIGRRIHRRTCGGYCSAVWRSRDDGRKIRLESFRDPRSDQTSGSLERIIGRLGISARRSEAAVAKQLIDQLQSPSPTGCGIQLFPLKCCGEHDAANHRQLRVPAPSRGAVGSTGGAGGTLLPNRPQHFFDQTAAVRRAPGQGGRRPHGLAEVARRVLLRHPRRAWPRRLRLTPGARPVPLPAQDRQRRRSRRPRRLRRRPCRPEGR